MSAAARMRRSPAFVSGAILTLVILGIAALAPVLAPYPPGEQDLTGGLLPPSAEHWFGTDQLGRDVLSRMLFAAQTDLRIAVVAAVAPFVIGVTVGLVAGYFGRATDWVASRITDTVIAFPFYVIVIAIVFAVGAGEAGIVLAFALVGWVGYARVIRAMTAALRESGWVQSARGGGLSHARVLLRHVLPNVLPQAIVLLATEIVLIMVAIVTLGYLGLGIQPPTPDWGTMIADGQAFITTQWWLSAIPGAAVVLTGIALSLLGDGIGDVLRTPVVSAVSVASAASDASGALAASAALIAPTAPTASGTPAGGVRGRHTPEVSRTPGDATALDDGAARSDAGAPSRKAARSGEVRVHALRIENSAGAPLVDGVSFEAAPGSAIGIVGESGSGKSLTLRALLGIMPAGTSVASAADSELVVGGPVGMVFQDPMTALDPLARVGSQLREAVVAAGSAAANPDARVRELLALVQLPDTDRMLRSYPHQLSGGQRQRIVIAMALAGDPAVLLCDEPTTALDVTVQRRVLDLLDDLRRTRGITLVFVSHDLAVVSSICERVLVMRSGRIVEEGAVSDVIRNARDPYTRGLLDAVPELPVLPDSPANAPAADSAPRPAATQTRPAAAPAEPLLVARDLEVRYGSTVALSGVSCEVLPGGTLGIVGESGSGKTTLARAIVGRLRPTAGEVRLGDRLVAAPRRASSSASSSASELREIQLVPQDPSSSLNPRLTVGQTLGELLRVHRIVPRSEVAGRITELLGLVRLDPRVASSYPYQLSGGQRQRVALARALAVEPRVIVADEPTSALDVSVQATVIELLRELRDTTGLTLVFISHDLAVVHALCDRVLVMRNGGVVETGDSGFFVAPRTSYGRELLEAVPRLSAA